MENLIQRTTDFAMTITGEYIRRQLTELKTQAKANKGIFVIDASCGNGHDTLALAQYLWYDHNSSEPEHASESQSAPIAKFLLAMDIQQIAVNNTRRLLELNGFSSLLTDGEKARQIRDTVAPLDRGSCSLPEMTDTIELVCDSHENIHSYVSHADIVIFNLGYLPGATREICTEASSTLSAVTGALDILRQGGLICITMYSGHEAGEREKAELLTFAEKLDSRKYHVSYINMLNQKNCPPEILLITRKQHD